MKGEIMPLASGKASLPPAGSVPTRLSECSAKARRWLESFSTDMLLSGGDLDMGDIAKTKVYEDPSLKDQARRLAFAADLWQAGMIGFTPKKLAQVSVFFVKRLR